MFGNNNEMPGGNENLKKETIENGDFGIAKACTPERLREYLKNRDENKNVSV